MFVPFAGDLLHNELHVGLGLSEMQQGCTAEADSNGDVGLWAPCSAGSPPLMQGAVL